MKLIVGDVGGTNARLALAAWQGGQLQLSAPRIYPSGEAEDFTAILARFMTEADAGGVAGASIGIAGPVRGNRCRTTNLPWQLDGAVLASDLGLPAVQLLNDLEAAGWGIEQVAPEHRRVLQAGDPVPQGNQAIIAAGTGLGEAGRVWCGERYQPFATEGSHADFAPGDATEMALMGWLGGWFGHVSWERLVSGQGLVNIYRFLREHGGAACHPDPLGAEDPAAAIALRAADDPLCGQALQRLVRLFGAETGNLALKLMATGGVYIAGGIAPKIADSLAGGSFLDAFTAKGRMRPLLQAMPVTLLSEPRLALMGAAVYGARQL